MSKSCSNEQRRLRQSRWVIAVSGIAFITVAAALPFLFPFQPKEDLPTQLRRGVAAAEQGDWKAFEEIVHRLGDDHESVTGAQVLRAVRALKEQRAEDALLLLPPRIEEPAVAALVWPVRVDALYRLGQLRLAESHLLEERERDSKNPLVHRWLSIIYYDLGAMEPAVTALQALAELAPDDPSPHQLLGEIYHDYERFSEAADSLSTFLAMSNGPPSVRRAAALRLADSQMRLRRYADALATLQDLDGSAEVWGRRAECHWNLGEHELAAQCIEAGLPLRPGDPFIAMMSAQVHVENDKYDEAIRSLELLLANDPHHLQGRYLLATCYRQSGNTERADVELARYKESERLRNRLAELHRIAVTDTWNADLRREIAQLCEELGRPALASMWRRAADSCQQKTPHHPAEPPSTSRHAEAS